MAGSDGIGFLEEGTGGSEIYVEEVEFIVSMRDGTLG